MIEAVNSVIVNSSLLRAATEQVDASRTPDVADSVRPPPQAPYVSPYIGFDSGSNKAVIQIRDSSTGDVLRQFPSETRLQQLAAEQAERSVFAQSSFDDTQSSGEASDDTQSSGGSGDIIGVSTPSSDAAATSANAEAKVAAAALTNGSQAGVQNLSAGVSVLA